MCDGEAVAFRVLPASASVDFTHLSPLTPERHLHLTMGSGVGWIDYDVDGRSDLFFTQGTPWIGSRLTPSEGPSDQIFRNLGNRFATVTAAGIESLRYGMGIAIGDFDNDGFSDLYISNFGPNLLFHNNGDGTFTEDTASSVLKDSAYGASCTWFDAEPDGDLDLFATNYLQIDDEDYTLCTSTENGTTLPIACPPWRYDGAPDLYFENLGDGTFRDSSESAGLREADSLAGLGVAAVDFDSDGDTEIFVANDSTLNQLWDNDGDGTFTEIGLPSGTALNREGKREAGMGVGVADIDQDGNFDIFLTHYFEESNTLYQNLGGMFFLDTTDEMGLAAASRPRLAFGTVLKDFSGDGHPDCFIANGHLHDRLEKLGRKIPYAQRPQIFLNREGKHFTDTSDDAGEYFQERHVGRGAAAGDFNLDGKLDIAVQHLNGPAVILENTTEMTGVPYRIQLIGTEHARDPIGAQLTIATSNRTLYEPYEGSSSYLSSNERTITWRLLPDEELKSFDVLWPGGGRERWSPSLSQRKTIWLIEGTGAPVPAGQSR